MGNSPFEKTALTYEEHERRLKLYKSGLIDREIAEELGYLSTSAVKAWRRKHDISPNQKRYFDEPWKKPVAIEILRGSLLGDGCLTRKGNRKNATYHESHASPQKDYMLWKNGFFMATYSEYLQKKGWGYSREGSLICRITSKQSSLLNRSYDDVYCSGKKRFTMEYMDTITDLGVLIWYLDDGNMDSYSDYMFITASGRSCDEIEVFINFFESRYECVVGYDKSGGRLVFRPRHSKWLRDVMLSVFDKYNLPDNMNYKCGRGPEYAKKRVRSKRKKKLYYLKSKRIRERDM